MYTFDSRVRYSETDENGNLSLESLIDYMQDCTNFQSEDLGVGLEYHRQKNIMWVLNFWQIVIDEYPAMGENITVGTQAFGFEKMFGHRNFLVTHQGEPEHRIAIANSLWVLMDLKKGRPMIAPTNNVCPVFLNSMHCPLQSECGYNLPYKQLSLFSYFNSLILNSPFSYIIYVCVLPPFGIETEPGFKYVKSPISSFARICV